MSYHHANDQAYYDEFCRVFSAVWGCIHDNSLRGSVDSDDSDYIMRRIREEYIDGTSCTLVLCGPGTRWRRFVDWEISATLDRGHALVGVHLPNNPLAPNGGVHKPDRLQDNLDSGYALWTSWRELARRGPDYLQVLVEVARARDPELIDNTRPLRHRSL